MTLKEEYAQQFYKEYGADLTDEIYQEIVMATLETATALCRFNILKDIEMYAQLQDEQYLSKEAYEFLKMQLMPGNIVFKPLGGR